MIKDFMRKIFVGLLLTMSIMDSSFAISEELTSTSFGELSGNFSNDLRYIIATGNNNASIPDQYIGKATGKTRAEMIENQTNSMSKLSSTSLLRSNSYHNYADFAIYGATTLLQEDYDSDGFYQTFSVSFDADIYSYTSSQLSEVYALLYISKDGGPWTHYYTTDNFIIESDSQLDEYEVMTTFLSGYPTDYYDILIDLYQVGYSDIVASYSSDDSNALYALSLESADYDEPYFEDIEIHHGGSISIVIIILLLLMYPIRKINSTTFK